MSDGIPDLHTFDGYSVTEVVGLGPKWIFRRGPGNTCECLAHLDYSAADERTHPQAITRYIPLAELTEDAEPVLYWFIDPEGKRTGNRALPFATALRDTLLAKEVTLRDISIMAGIAVTRVSALRMGTELPTAREVRTLAVALHQDADDWLCLAADSAVGGTSGNETV